MNRRQFFSALGAATAIMVGKPVAVNAEFAKCAELVTTAMYGLAEYLPLDVINAFAFTLHAEVFPEHREHYRTMAMNILARRDLDRKEKGL